MNENNSSKQILLSVLGVAILVVAVVGVSFAAFTFSQAGEKENQITTGTLTMAYTEGENGILIENMMPTKDETGKGLKDGQNVFDFNVSATIKSSDNPTINFTISAKKEESTLEDKYAKLYLEEYTSADYQGQGQAVGTLATYSTGTPNTTTGMPADEMELYSDTFTETKTRYFRLRMWVADTYGEAKEGATHTSDLNEAKTFKVKVNVYAKAAAL